MRRAPAAPAALLPAAALLLAAASTAAAAPPQRVERQVSAMGTTLTVVVEAAARADALAASERAVRAVEAVEARLSTWRGDSELARLNRAPVGQPVELSPELAADLAAADACRTWTAGAFDPGVGALVAAWGLRDGGRVPGEAELAGAVAASGLRHLELEAGGRAEPRQIGEGESGGRRAVHGAVPPVVARAERKKISEGKGSRGAVISAAAGGRTRAASGGAAAEGSSRGRAAGDALAARAVATRLHAGLRIEEGGFGKGAGLAAAVSALAPLLATDGESRDAPPPASTPLAEGVRITSAMLDLGGQVVLLGTPSSAAGWTVAVADPRDRGRQLLAVTVDGGSLATSGNGERGIEVGGRRYGHLLDPASGRPVADFGSLTVWTADPLAADCLSTGLYVLGPERALDWAAGTPGVEVLTVEVGEDGAPRVRATAGWAGRIAPLVQGLDVELSRDGRTGHPHHEPRAGVAVPWEGRPAARSKPASPESGTGSMEEYR